MYKRIIVVVLVVLFFGGCLFNLSLEDLGQSEDLQNLEVKAETDEEGNLKSLDIVVETKEEAIAEVVGEAIKEGTSVLPTAETE